MGIVQRLRSDAGFSLADAGIATIVVAMLVSMFGGIMGGALRSSRINAQTQEAVALGLERIEFARSLTWSEVAMTAIDEGAPWITSAGTHLDALDAGLENDEMLIVAGGGVLAPSGTETVDTTTYTVWQYVTDAGNGLRRVVVLVTWKAGGATPTHQTSVLIAEGVTR